MFKRTVVVCLSLVYVLVPEFSSAQIVTSISGSAHNSYNVFTIAEGCKEPDIYPVPPDLGTTGTHTVSSDCVLHNPDLTFSSSATLSASGQGNHVGVAVDARASITGQSPDPDFRNVYATAGGAASAKGSDTLTILQGGFFSVRSILRSQVLLSDGCNTGQSNPYETAIVSVGAELGGFGMVGGSVTNCDQQSLDQSVNQFFNTGDQLSVSYYATAVAVASAVYPEHTSSTATANAGHTFYLVITPLSPGAAFESANGIDYSELPSDPEFQYQFAGFGEPITMGVTNIAQGGRTLPVIWRLTDLQGNPISDANSFAGVFSFQTACDSTTGADPVESYLSGSSNLQYLGDGYWQFNWKTDKSYSGQCRRMYLQLSDGQMSEQVKFQFK